tara:strand:+ start:15139 stop:15474 length:336 start_codon:yes stop_codon:yes gene_type:complete
MDIVITIDAKFIDRTILTKVYPTRFFAKHRFAPNILWVVYNFTRMAFCFDYTLTSIVTIKPLSAIGAIMHPIGLVAFCVTTKYAFHFIFIFYLIHIVLPPVVVVVPPIRAY